MRITTITATASTGQPIDLHACYDRLTAIAPLFVGHDECVYMKHHDVAWGTPKRKRAEPCTVPKNRKRFNHPLTLSFKTGINVKLFSNGNIQLTGIKSVKGGKLFVDSLVSIVWNDDTKNVVYDVRLMNGLYDSEFSNVDRYELHRYIKTHHQHLHSFFDPHLHPGVKMVLMYDHERERFAHEFSAPDQASHRKSTVFVFKSGKVMITGAKCEADLDRAKAFTDDCLRAFTCQAG